MTAFTAELAARIVAEVPEGLPQGTRPPAGASVGLVAGGATETAAAGWRLPGQSAPMTTGTHHDLASVTKVVATVPAIMRLASERQVRLDDPVSRYLAPFAADGKSGITLRDLLLHRGGLSEWQPLYFQASNPVEAIRIAAELPLRYAPGSGRHYSDLGFMLLGAIVSQASGMPLDAAVRQLVTEPLGLAATRYRTPQGVEVAAGAFGDSVEKTMVDTDLPYPVPHTSAEFSGWRDHLLVGEVSDGNAFHALDGVSGHAGLFSTLDDLLSFGSALAGYRDHDRLWSEEVASQFFAEGPDAGQSLGFRRYPLTVTAANGATSAVTVLGHTGFVGCAVGFVPGQDLAIALASNRLLTTGTPVPGDRLWQSVLAAVGDHLGQHPDQASDPALPNNPVRRP